jgi:tripartite-type tricarboxylate transporter receptor subunit TctC
MTRAQHRWNRVALAPLRVGSAVAWLVLSAPTFAQSSNAAQEASYPNKPIRIVMPVSPGGGGDIMARAIGQKLTETWHQAVVVDNRPGAATMIGTEIVARAAPNGYTLVMATSSHAINPSLYPKMPFDPIKDFSPVTMIAVSPLLLVAHPSLPVKSVSELAVLAKARPGKLNFASGGPSDPARLYAHCK